MEATDVVEVMEALDAGGVTAWLDGGWGVDALLGEQTRQHADLDLIVPTDEVWDARSVLSALGFHPIVERSDGTFLLRDARGREVDVHPVRFDADGEGAFLLEDGRTWCLPAEAFAGTGRITKMSVRCLTAKLR